MGCFAVAGSVDGSPASAGRWWLLFPDGVRFVVAIGIALDLVPRV
jgi:hypothetical protein